MSSVRAFTTVFQREVLERRLLLAAALVLGLVPLLVPILPRVGSGSLSELRGATALAIAATFGSVVALALGASVIARDLAERRLSFYFSRPLPGWTIWAGKLAAGAALVLGGAALILLPTWLLGDKPDPSGHWGGKTAGTGEVFLFAVCALLVLLLVGHAAGVILRSRSPWLILDLVACLVAGWLLLDSLHVLGVFGATTAFVALAATLLCLVPLALLAAGAVQVVRGRTDLRRSHRLLSLTLWGLLLVFAFAAQSVSHWVLSATPQDLERIEIGRPAPTGDWVYVQGEAAHRGDYAPSFLLDTSSGRSVQVRRFVASRWELRSAFSADGRRAVWTYWMPPGAVGIETVDLTHSEAGPVQTPISFNSYVQDLALSPDGRRLATLVGNRLQVDEFPSGRILASVALPWKDVDLDSARLVFGDRIIRILAVPFVPGGRPIDYAEHKDHVLQMYEYDLRSKALVKTGEIDFHDMVWDLSNNDHADRLVLRNRETSSVQVHDARTGEVKLALPVPQHSGARVLLLAGDRLALAFQRHGQPSELRVLSGDGTPLRRLQLVGPITLGGQPTPGTLVVASGSLEKSATSWLLDLDTGKVKRIGNDLVPFSWGDLRPGSTGTKLFTGKAGRLLWIDPLTGRQRVVLPGHR
jgi:hypothetical protein